MFILYRKEGLSSDTDDMQRLENNNQTETNHEIWNSQEV